MRSFNSILLLHTLRAIAKEIEDVDPNNPALPQLQYTINQKAAELMGEPMPVCPSAQLRGAA